MDPRIDKLGRLVVAKPRRDGLGLIRGRTIELESHDGVLVGHVVSRVRRGRHDHGPVLELDDPQEQLTAEQVRAILERVRR